MSRRIVGFIEAIGLASAITAADAAVKAANVKLIGYEYSGYHGRIVVKVEGNAGAVRAAVKAGEAATYQVVSYYNGDMRGCQSTLNKYALDETVYDKLVDNRLTVSTEKQRASGKRPQGTSKHGKRAGVWDGRGKYISN